MTLPFGKLAGAAGIAPAPWALVISLGAGGVLLVYLLTTGHRVGLDTGRLRYFFIAAAISYAIPNLLMFSAIPHLGTGYTGIMFTLSPVITLMLSILFGVRKPTLLGMAGNRLSERIFAFTEDAALIYGRLMGEASRHGREMSIPDGMIAVIALANHAKLATRNLRHFADTGIDLVNPWDF